jgi:hypothetical protein
LGAFVDRTGQIFGRLTVLERHPENSKSKQAQWVCLCTCGNKIITRNGNLQSKNTRSCGCLHKESVKGLTHNLHRNNVNPMAAFNKVMSSYKVHARRRGLEFSLTRERFYNLIIRNCHFCGAPPSNTSVADSGNVFKYNGVDRGDSKKGYIIGNCAPCCRTCNWMKKDTSVYDFIVQVRKIAKHTRRFRCPTELAI